MKMSNYSTRPIETGKRKRVDQSASTSRSHYHCFGEFVFRPSDIDSFELKENGSDWELEQGEAASPQLVVRHKGYTAMIADPDKELFRWLVNLFQPTFISKKAHETNEES